LSITKEWLEEEYVNKQRNAIEIAKDFNCSSSTIIRRIREYGLNVKNAGQLKWRDLQGKTFGDLYVIKEIIIDDNKKNHSNKWLCFCKGCNKNKQICGSNLNGGDTNRCLQCRLANSKINKSLILSDYWKSIRSSAIRRNIPYSLTKEEVVELYEKQDRRCALTNVRLNMADNYQSWKNGVQTASLDRIDSLKGYTIDNVQWVHKDINQMKWDIPNEDFIKWCNLVAKTKPYQIEEEKESPSVFMDDEEVSEWDSFIWKSLNEKFKHINYEPEETIY
jgi:hypothetical protein